MVSGAAFNVADRGGRNGNHAKTYYFAAKLCAS